VVVPAREGRLQRGACRGDEGGDSGKEGGAGEGSVGMVKVTILAREEQPACPVRWLQDEARRASGNVDLRNGRR
jgi:hypothetical protein